METTILKLVIWLSFCVCIFLAWYFTHKAKHKERLLMIEKGMNPNEFAQQNWNFKNGLLKLGIVIIGLSLGLLVIALMIALNLFGHSDATPIAILGLFGGGALIIANRINLGKK